MTDEANTQENAGTAGEAGEPAIDASGQASDSAQLTSAAATSAPESAASTALGQESAPSTSQAAGESASDAGKPADSAALALASGSDGELGNAAAGLNSADLTSQEPATPSGSLTESETSSGSVGEPVVNTEIPVTVHLSVVRSRIETIRRGIENVDHTLVSHLHAALDELTKLVEEARAKL